MFKQLTRPAGGPTIRSSALLAVGQILLWGGSFYLPAVLAAPIIHNTGWPLSWVYGALSVGLLVSGLLAPWVGRRIARPGGAGLVRFSGVVMGLGLLGAAAASSLLLFELAWVVIGVGMALGLYDALFAALGTRYGYQAKAAIVQVTLISGFCTTVVWPALAWAVAHAGWRGTCAGYGVLLVLVIWPLYKVALPTGPVVVGATVVTGAASVAGPAAPVAPRATPGLLVFWLLTAHFVLAAVIVTVLSVQLVEVLRAQGLSLAGAVGLGALIGPSSVAVRVLDMLGPPRPSSFTAVLSGLLLLAGLALVGWLPQVAAVGIVCYGLGSGMRSILRGTLPLELYGPVAYPVVMGQLARPVLLVQALTPLAGGLLAARFGPLVVLKVLGGLGVLNVAVTLVLRAHLAAQPVVHEVSVAA